MESTWSPDGVRIHDNLLFYQIDAWYNSTEKAGVGGSIPSLATMSFKDLRAFRSLKRHHWSPNGVQTLRGGQFRFVLRPLFHKWPQHHRPFDPREIGAGAARCRSTCLKMKESAVLFHLDAAVPPPERDCRWPAAKRVVANHPDECTIPVIGRP